MTARGHVLLALPFASLGAHVFGLQKVDYFIFVSIVAIASLLPDVDEVNSYAGRRLWWMSWLIKLLGTFFPSFRHRGITHLFIIPIALAAIAYYFKSVWIAAFAIGWLAHTIGDLMTVGGIVGYFSPFATNKKVNILPKELRFYTGSATEHTLIVILFISNIAILLSIFKSHT